MEAHGSKMLNWLLDAGVQALNLKSVIQVMWSHHTDRKSISRWPVLSHLLLCWFFSHLPLPRIVAACKSP
jgi:hypothetical protein